MRFVQIVEYATSRPDEMRALGEEFAASREGDAEASRVVIYKDRDATDRYLAIAEFPSYDAAMANSSAPATQEFAARMMALADGPPIFRNLDEHYVASGG